MSAQCTYLTAAAVKAIHEEVLRAHGGSSGIRNEALLQSAVAAPQATMMGRLMISEPLKIAAAYLFYICRNHAFIDGNKRAALAACLLFLWLNKSMPEPVVPVDAWEAFVLDVAASRLDRAQTSARLRELVTELAAS